MFDRLRARLLFNKDDGEKNSGDAGLRVTGHYPPARVPEPEDRVVRIFVSSTFKDMYQEREVLVKQVFPELKKRCRERGIEFIDVDLRWGITEAQSMRGETLSICLSEIENCRPYFIGILSERYGWVPENIGSDLMSTNSWIEGYRDRSVTELEILYGVLENKAMESRAFFYFRDPSYLERLPEDQLDRYVSKSAEDKLKLEKLKDRIRASGYPLFEGYKGPEALAELVINDLWDAIDKRFPGHSTPDPLEIEAADHKSFARSRALVYIGRKEYFDRLDKHIDGDGQPLVLTGESGCGKSALLANWAMDYEKRHPGKFMFLHFTGSTRQSSDYSSIISRLMGELKKRYNWDGPIPDNNKNLVEQFPRWLSEAASKEKIILIIDALDQLEDRDGAAELVWMPSDFPANVRVLLSSKPGKSLDEVKSRNWQLYEIQDLTINEREMLITQYLCRYRKSLEKPLVEKIASAPQTANPLFLRALVEELRVFGIYEVLEKRIDYYLSSKSCIDLYEKILARLEEDYEKDRPHLVSDATALIWASRKGITQGELLAMLGNDGNPLPRMIWSPLYLALQESLVDRSGYLTFFHDYVSKAVENKYLGTDEQKSKAHLKLADYFLPGLEGATTYTIAFTLVYYDRSDKDDLQNRLTEALHIKTATDTGRSLEEYPWQLAMSASWDRLYGLLTEGIYFMVLWRKNAYEVRTLWTILESKSDYRMDSAYNDAKAIYGRDPYFIQSLSHLFEFRGLFDNAMGLRTDIVNAVATDSKKWEDASIMNQQAATLIDLDRLDEAQALVDMSETICKKADYKDELANSYLMKARIMHKKDFLEEGLKYLDMQEKLLKETGTQENLRICLQWKGVILRKMKRFDEAEAISKESERQYAIADNQDGVVSSEFDQAALLVGRGDYDKAAEHIKKPIAMCRASGNRNWLVQLLHYGGTISRLAGRYEAALEYLKESEEMAKGMGRDDLVMINLLYKSVVLGELNHYKESVETARACENLMKETGNMKDYELCIISHADSLSKLLKESRSTMPYREYRKYQDEYLEISHEHPGLFK
jgi:nephrocystin-3